MMSDKKPTRVAIMGVNSSSVRQAMMIQAMLQAGAVVEYVDVNGDSKKEKIVGCKVDGMVIDEWVELHAMPDLDEPRLSLPKNKVNKPYFRQKVRW